MIVVCILVTFLLPWQKKKIKIKNDQAFTVGGSQFQRVGLCEHPGREHVTGVGSSNLHLVHKHKVKRANWEWYGFKNALSVTW